jgi:hypothetical protein
VGTVGGREIEHWLGELGVAEAPRAARLARLAGGRPGLALAYAHSADAERVRGEIARGLLDMLAESRAARLASIRELMKSAASLDAALDSWRRAGPAGDVDGPTPTGRGRKGKTTKTPAPPAAADADAVPAMDVAPVEDAAAPKLAAAGRRSAAATLLDIWASVARDLSVAGAGGRRQLRELDLVDELRAAAAGVSSARLGAFLARLGEIDAQLDENVNPELALDVLALSWPRVDAAAAAPGAAAPGAAAPRAGATAPAAQG